MRITPEATRAARGLLGWTLQQLAEACGVSFETLSRFENGRPLRESTEAKIVAALQKQGVDLVADKAKTGALLRYARRRER